MPLWLCLVGAAAGVSLYSSAVLFAWAACVFVCARLALRMACGWRCVRVVRLVSGVVFYYVRRGVPARLFVCRLCPTLSHVAGLLRFVLFVGYCML